MADHPRLFLTHDPDRGLRTIGDLQRDILEGWSCDTWLRIFSAAAEALKTGPVLPDADLPGRPPSMVEHRNPDFTVCDAAGQQVLRAALVHLLTGRPEFKASALAQLRALYDPEVWPDWIDQSHVHFGYRADLRTGMLSQAVGLAYDWLAPSLSTDERDWVIEGLNRRGIQPYLASLQQDPWWTRDLNNWLACIVGGLGIAGMALDGEHPDARLLIDFAVDKMEEYCAVYGPEGEFNESVGYAGANRLLVDFFQAHRHWSGGKQNRLAQTPFPEMCHWVMQTTLPPGRVVSVGDCHPEGPVTTGYVASVAAANHDGILQWLYQQYQAESDDPYQLVSYDPQLAAVSPAGKIPVFKSFSAHGRIVVSRTDWSPQSTACVVHAKAGREENHEHNDVGQLCLDGFGERLIVDPGSPSGYPADFFEGARWQYYNASIRGHNVLMFDGAEQRSPDRQRGKFGDVSVFSGRVVSSKYVPGLGAAWKMDLSAAYSAGQRVTRTVLHLYPGYVAVLDEAVLDQARAISLRWHTCDRAEPDDHGKFTVRGKKAKVAAQVKSLGESEARISRHEHEYVFPYDRDRMGAVLAPRRESFIEAKLAGDSCRLLTLFSVSSLAVEDQGWVNSAAGWSHGEVCFFMGAQGSGFSSNRGMLSLDCP
ncbi:MAG: heparinase II/III-family protein [Cephaloticoccus sp.]|nr:heparinase II/III-family protein [Cephaloticoccus sp.]MCF7760286.1 heparinase II/III-family protein [Cephaloticoccus sp.]